MVTEMEKIDFILKEGATKNLHMKEFIKKQISEFEESDIRKGMIEGQKYYENITEIQNKQRYYIDDNQRIAASKFFSNFKLAHSIPRKLVNQKAGLLLKKNITVKEVIDDGQKEDPEYKKQLKKTFNDRMHKRLKYTLIEAVNKGISWWQVYIDEDGKLKVRRVNAEKIVVLWQDDEHEVVDAIIMVYKMVLYEGTEKKIVKKAEYWDLEGVRYLIYENGELINDVERLEEVKDTVLKEDDGNGMVLCSHFIYDGHPSNWEKIPFIYWKYNGDEKPLIYYLKSLIDCYDELTSIMADIIKDAPNGVNVVKNYAEDIKKFNKNLQELNTIFLDEDGDYRRENITIDINAFKEFIELLRRDIYETGAGVDTQSEKFQTAQSGVALEELFNDLDLDCSNIETEFQSSLEYFMFFENTYLQMTTAKDYHEKEVDFVFNKTMITNEKEKIENCKNSEDLSKKSRLAHHPWVKDVDAELEQIEAEEKAEREAADNEYDELIKQMNKNKNNDGASNGSKVGGE